MSYSPLNNVSWYKYVHNHWLNLYKEGVMTCHSCHAVKWKSYVLIQLSSGMFTNISTILWIWSLFHNCMWGLGYFAAYRYVYSESLLSCFKFLSIKSMQLYIVLHLWYPIRAKAFLNAIFCMLYFTTKWLKKKRKKLKIIFYL